ncbi:hypothetical protein QBC46DRAFT_394652 [Diplogelasinospora grovesii]|uniref:Ubiquitin-like domain-containing protein n=1 Tax=Diplogelasinospora grovesii TaxID=303347 RepID=A0AAN6N0P7_9PEZI|nr:hypothetical protein QBC46DRAFT_394652 [Diplogelasinospora grovesii]
MDPLSIAASVAGLLAAGGKLVAVFTLISRLSDAPPLCRAALTELCDISSALRQIQKFLQDQASIPSGRREHVLLEHLAAALTGCVMTKDELETVVDNLGLVYHHQSSWISGTFDRARWIRKEKDIQTMIQRLQNHKSSLNLILTVFQCSAMSQVQDSVARLCDLFEQSIAGSSALSMRLSRLEGMSDCGSTIRHSAAADIAQNAVSAPSSFFADNGGGDAGIISWDRGEGEEEDSTAGSIRTFRRRPSDAVVAVGGTKGKEIAGESGFWETDDMGGTAAFTFTFDATLQSSRVYRRLQLTTCFEGQSETSITTSARQCTALSIFCKIALDEISNLSLFSLPIFVQEISNNRWYTATHVSLSAAINNFRTQFSSNERMGTGTYHFAEMVLIIVKTAAMLGRKTVLCRTMGLNDYCGYIKRSIALRKGIPQEWQNLLFNGRSLEDGKTLEEYGIDPLTEIAEIELQVTVRLGPQPVDFQPWRPPVGSYPV